MLFLLVSFPLAAEALAASSTQEEEVWRLYQGRAIYRSACLPCHGENGTGNGPRASSLDPKPWDFTKGSFKWRTTPSGSLPTDDDLDRTVREGVPGTSMPAWKEVFGREERLTVIQYVKSFSSKWKEEGPEAPITITAPPKGIGSPESIAKGREVYEKMQCAKCHGEAGRGDGPAADTLKDDWGQPIEAYDFTKGFYRSGGTDADLYRTFSTGVNGTPMPAYEAYEGGPLTDADRWHLIDYIKTFSRPKGLVWWLFFEEPGKQ